MLLTKIVKKPVNINSVKYQKQVFLNYFNLKMLKTKNKKNFLFFLVLIKLFLSHTSKKNIFLKELWSNTFLTYYNFTENHFINYILKMDFNNSNIKINLLSCKGNSLFKNSSGILGYKSSNKSSKIALNAIIKKIKFKTQKYRHFPFSIHLLGVKFNKRYIIQKFNKFINLKIIKSYNLVPFNGCRPLKKKRKKLKKKILLI